MTRTGIWAVCLVALAQGAQADCGATPDACSTSDGAYHIRLPDDAENAPVVVFLHGFNGKGSATIRNDRVIGPLLDRGYAVIAPEGMKRNGDGPQSWGFLEERAQRDETAFLTGVVDDAAARFGTSADDAILSGFSAGGFMVNYLACSDPDAFTAYAPVSGGFWRPHPETCAGPVRLFHTHGWRDGVVPLEGRMLGGGAYQQGDIFAGLEIWRAANACYDEKPSGFDEAGAFMHRRWSDCAPGSALEFVLFPGGHTVPEGWADMMLDWFEQTTS